MLNFKFIREVGYLKFFKRTFSRQFYKRILKVDNQITLPNGIKMNLPKHSHFASEVYVTNCDVDWGSEALLVKYLEPDKIFLDIGANIGYYSLIASPYVEKVYAFEPDYRNISWLQDNIKKVNNVELIEEGIYSRNCEIKFDVSRSTEVSRIIKDETSYVSSETINIKCTTVDDFLTGRNTLSVTAIKTDIEGSDFDAIIGAKRTIERDQPLILSEFAIVSDDLLSYVENLNYTIYAFVKLLDSESNNRSINKKSLFTEIDYYNRENYHYNMLFLVPKRLNKDFANFSLYSMA